MQTRLFLICALAASVLSLAAPRGALAQTSSIDQAATELYSALQKGEPFSSLDIAPEQRTSENAYAIQKAFVAKRVQGGEKIIGFKAALTAPAQRERFGATEAAWAPLFSTGFLSAATSGDTLSLSPFKGMMLEVELAFKIGRSIKEPVKNVTALKEMISGIHAAIEVPQLYFADMASVGYFDIVATGIGSKQLLLGKGHDVGSFVPDRVDAVLKHEGKIVNTGKGRDVLDGQWEALLWLVNSALAGGYVLEPGQIFITGALGRMLPAQVGSYEAQYSFDKIDFAVRSE